MVAGVQRRCRAGVATGQSAEEDHRFSEQEDRADRGEHGKADDRGDRRSALADQEHEDHEECWRQLDRCRQAGQDALRDTPPLAGRIGQQVRDHQRHQYGVHLAVSQCGTNRLDCEYYRDADEPKLPAPGCAATLQHRLLGPDKAACPDHLPEPIGSEGQRRHQNCRDRRIDEVEPPARRRGGQDVLARQHVLDRIHIDLKVNRRRLPGKKLAAFDDERQDQQRHRERRQKLHCPASQPPADRQ